MSSPRRQSLAKLLLVVVSTLAALLFLEGGLRIYFALVNRDISLYRPSFYYSTLTKENRNRFTSHPFLPYAPRPFDKRKMLPFRPDVGRIVECDYTNNSFGFRTPERPFKKPPMTKRVITLGGSTTFDGPTNEQTWSALLEKRLNEHYAGSGHTIEVINLGVDMANSPYSLIDLAFLGVEYEPDLVISYDGVNDTLLLGYDGLTPDYRSSMSKFDVREQTLQSRLPQWIFKSYLLSWASFKYDRIAGDRPDLAGQVIEKKVSQLKPSSNQLEGIQYFERNLKLMRAISSEYKAKFLAATGHWVHPPEKVVVLNEELRNFFGREGIDFLDLDKDLPHDDWSIHVDEVHWSLKGEEAMAKEWALKIIATDSLRLGAGPELNK
jgi:hypothetical protein